MRLRPAAPTERTERPSAEAPPTPTAPATPVPQSRPVAEPAPTPTSPTVSIVVPVLPGATYLGDAVASALAQDRPADEIVLVDAGPAGGPGSVIEAARIGGLRYVALPDTPAAALWNRGIEESTGDIVIVLDADDILLASAITDHLAVLGGSDIGVSAGDVVVLGSDLRPADEAYWGPSSVVGHLTDGDWLPAGSLAFARTALATVGSFREELTDGWLAEWLAGAVASVEIAPAGRHTVARRGIGFDEATDPARALVLRTLLETAGPTAMVAGPDVTNDAEAWLEVGLRLLRLGDAEGALGCFERAEADTPTPAGAEMVSTVRAALGAGELEVMSVPAVRSGLGKVPTSPQPTPGVRSPVGRSGPSVTIAIPTFDRAHLLGQAIESAIAQTRPAEEILVVDDGSTDDTRDVVARYAGERVRYVHQENRGGPLARNRCIEEASGDWLLWLDSDDVIVPETIALHLDRLAGAPDADVVYGDLDVVDAELHPTRHQGYQDWYGDRDGLVAALFDGNCIPNPSTMIRRSVLVGAGGYHPDFRRAHDYEMFSRLAATADFAHHPDTVLRYRMHDGDALSGTMEGKDLRFELTVVHGLLGRHPLRTLIPDAGWGVVDQAEAEATAHIRVAVRLVQLGDVTGGLEHARIAASLRPIPEARELVSTLDEALRSGLVGHRPFPVVDLAAVEAPGIGAGIG